MGASLVSGRCCSIVEALWLIAEAEMGKLRMVTGLLLLLVACQSVPGAQNPQLTIYTQPTNANVREIAGDIIGKAPLSLTYEGESLRDADGCIVITGFVAIWPSGEQASTPPTLHLCDNHAAYQLAIDQAQGVVGFEADIDYAERQRRIRQQQIRDEQYEDLFAEQLRIRDGNAGQPIGNNHD